MNEGENCTDTKLLCVSSFGDEPDTDKYILSFVNVLSLSILELLFSTDNQATALAIGLTTQL